MRTLKIALGLLVLLTIAVLVYREIVFARQPRAVIVEKPLVPSLPPPSQPRVNDSSQPISRPPTVNEMTKAAEDAPLPRSLADFPQTETVKRGWKSVRDADIFGFGEGYTLAYLGILGDLQECTRGRVGSRGKLHLTAEWTLEQRNGKWVGTIKSISPEQSWLDQVDDSLVLECLDKNIGKEVLLDDNKSGTNELTSHWLMAFPLRESRIYKKVLAGGKLPTSFSRREGEN